MKQKRRQELQTNELAQILTDIRENFSRYGSYILGGLAALIIIVALSIYINRADTAARNEDVQKIREARFVGTGGLPLPADQVQAAIESLQQVAADTSDADVARRALLALSGGVLEACVIEPRGVTTERLQAAEDACTQLLRDYGRQPVIAGAALMYLAVIEGNRFVLDEDAAHKNKAREYLTRITQNAEGLFDGTPFMERALDELNRLDETYQVVTLAPPKPAPSVTVSPTGPGEAVPAPPVEPGTEQSIEVDLPEVPAGGDTPEEAPQ